MNPAFQFNQYLLKRQVFAHGQTGAQQLCQRRTGLLAIPQRVERRLREPSERRCRFEGIDQFGADHPLWGTVDGAGNHGSGGSGGQVHILHMRWHVRFGREQEPGSHGDARRAVGKRGHQTPAVIEAACGDDRNARPLHCCWRPVAAASPPG